MLANRKTKGQRFTVESFLLIFHILKLHDTPGAPLTTFSVSFLSRARLSCTKGTNYRNFDFWSEECQFNSKDLLSRNFWSSSI